MKLYLRDIDYFVVEAWKTAFKDFRVEISRGDIFDGFPIDALVSPANSHGDMSGGIDALYTNRWPDIQQRVNMAIASLPKSFLPIGDCIALATGEEACPRLLIAPTMEVPGPVPKTNNAFLAMMAVLRVAQDLNISSILCPGLCTWSGEMDPMISALQMRAACDTCEMLFI